MGRAPRSLAGGGTASESQSCTRLGPCHSSLALVEVLVHLPSGILPAYSAIPVEFDDSLVTALEPSQLPASWRQHPPPAETKAIGDDWVAGAQSAVLRVPSVVVPNEFNDVLNPLHPDFAEVRIGAVIPFPFDPRLPSP